MIKRLALILAAVAALATAVGVLIVSSAYALFALASPSLGPAGGAAVVALAAAILALLVALAAWLMTKPKHIFPAKSAPQSDLAARAMTVVRERPIIAAGALIAGALIAMRNPALTALLVKSLMDSRKPTKR